MDYLKDTADGVQTFGTFMRQKREEKSITVRGLAAMLGVTPAYVSDLEKGNRAAPRKNSPRDLLERICQILMITEEDRHRYYDLAAESRDGQYDELNDYLHQHANARMALRVARDSGMDENEWSRIVQQIQKRSNTNK